MVYAGDMTDATDAKLAQQYEAYPYPRREPRDEAKRLIIGSPGHLREIDYWVQPGAAGVRQPRPPLRAVRHVQFDATGDGTRSVLAQGRWRARAGQGMSPGSTGRPRH